MDILGMDVRFHQPRFHKLVYLIHVMITLFAMGMVTVSMEYVIVYMDILGMDVRFHQMGMS
jgi:hypothetical protein